MGKTDDETVCSFCGMSHLMYKEMRTKDKRIAELEKQLAGTERLHAAAAKNTAESKQHYAQLKQMQESCAEQLAGLTDAQRKLAASEAEAARLRVELSVSREEATEAARAREADAEKWAAERRTLETASASRVQALEVLAHHGRVGLRVGQGPEAPAVRVAQRRDLGPQVRSGWQRRGRSSSKSRRRRRWSTRCSNRATTRWIRS